MVDGPTQLALGLTIDIEYRKPALRDRHMVAKMQDAETDPEMPFTLMRHFLVSVQYPGEEKKPVSDEVIEDMDWWVFTAIANRITDLMSPGGTGDRLGESDAPSGTS